MSLRFQVNLRGIIDLLSSHLYSRPEVYLRELLQNSVDALTARRSLDPGLKGEINLTLTESTGQTPTLEVVDNGIGLTEEEVHTFLATIGESSKRSADGSGSADFLGKFGIGFLSCFVVCDELVVVTQCARPGFPPVEWRGFADGNYSTRTLEASLEPGTRVYLKCRPGQEAMFQFAAIRDQVKHYGNLLPDLIRVTCGKQSEVVNQAGVPWRKAFASDKDRSASLLKYGNEVFGHGFLDAIPLYSRAGEVDGVAYVLPHAAKLNSRRAHRVYLKGMLLSESAENLLPDWAIFARAIVDAKQLRPTASRESFYEDERLEAARQELGDCLRQHLVTLASQESARFQRFLSIHHLALKALAAQDEACFRLFIEWLPFETSHGMQTVTELRQQAGPLRFVDDIAQFHQLEGVARAQGFTLINAGYVYDRELLARLGELDSEVQLLRVEADSLTQDFEELTAEEAAASETLLEVASDILRKFQCRPELRKFKPAELPAMFCLGTEARFLRSLNKSKETANPLFLGVLSSLENRGAGVPESVLAFNFSNPMLRHLIQVRSRKVLACTVELLYVQSLLLAHQPLTGEELKLMNQGLAGLIDEVIDRPWQAAGETPSE